MIKVTYVDVMDSLYDKLSKLHIEELKGEGSEDIQILSNCVNDIVFKNTKTMKQIMIECEEQNTVKIYITDYYNQKLLLEYREDDARRIKEWTELFNRYKKLLNENEEILKFEEVEKVVWNFFV